MARISRIRGPNSSFAVPSSPAVITGFTFTRSFGDGTLFIAGSISVLNLHGSNVSYQLIPVLDGVQIRPTFGSNTIETLQAQSPSFTLIEPVEQGEHTLELQMTANVAAVIITSAGSGEFIVVELPEWDSDDFLVTL